MRRTLKAAGREYERGAIAVEAAIVLPMLLVFLGVPSIVCAFYFRQYTAVQKAAHDAAIYLSTAPRQEMTAAGPDSNFAALTLANNIVKRELAGIVPATAINWGVTCTYRYQSTTKETFCTPQVIQTDYYILSKFSVSVGVPFVNPVTGRAVSTKYMLTVVAVPYVGNY